MAEVVDEPSWRERRFLFRDRYHAGQLLARKLEKYKGKRDVVVLAVPAGGVPVAYSISERLSLPLDVVIVRKMQIPWNTEAGFGALAWDGEVVLNDRLVRDLDLSEETVGKSVLETKKMIENRLRKFKKDGVMLNLRGRTAIVVDDGLASGFTMLAAVRAIRKMDPREIIVAVPTASLDAVKLLEEESDAIICLNIRSGRFFAVAEAYINWHDLSDQDVLEILERRSGERRL
ncbi:MAG: phosphoribosyltransferase [Nitrososphaeria archaeon]